jgi:hypothetical protein
MIPLDREQEPVVIKHYTNSVDEYGQRHTEYTTSSGTMFIRKHKQSLYDDPRFNNVVLIGLTKRADINENDHIIYKDQEYKVIYSIMAKRYNSYFMEIYE